MKENELEVVQLGIQNEEDQQGMVSLYEKHPDLGLGTNEEERKDRGFSSVERLKEKIQEESSFVIAKKEGEVVGAGQLTHTDWYDTPEEMHFWTDALFVDETHRGQKISTAIEETREKVAIGLLKEKGQKQFFSCGIAPDNERSQKIHINWGYIKVQGEEADIYRERNDGKYELWRKELKQN